MFRRPVKIFFLPVTEEQRSSWTQKPPDRLKEDATDLVSFQATGRLGNAKDKNLDKPSAVCYADLRPLYNHYDIICRPKWTDAPLGLEDAHRFLGHMTDVGVVPEGVEVWEKEGIYCRIPADLAPSPLIYATLTCHRWIDSHPRLVWEFLRILERDSQLHPFQVLTYVVHKYVLNMNHSFLGMGSFGATGDVALEAGTNPLLGVSAKIFFDAKDSRGNKVREATKEVRVNDTIGDIAIKLSPKVTVKNPSQWGPDKICAPKYQLEKPVDNLHPALTELYRLEQPNTSQVESVMAPLFTIESQRE